MTLPCITIEPEQSCHDHAIEALQARAFGPGRFARTAYRLREGTQPVSGLSHIVCLGEQVIGSIRYAPVVLAGRAGLMLGPLVVHPDHASRGHGLALMRRTLDLAKDAGHAWVILVGDEPYYARAGFSRVPIGQVTLPGPVDPLRLLWLELQPGSVSGLSGLLQAAAG